MLLTSSAKTGQGRSIDSLCHSVKVDEKTQEDLVRSGTVFMYTAEIAQNGNARHILSMKSEHACGLRAHVRCAFWRRYLAMQMLMLLVVCGRNLR